MADFVFDSVDAIPEELREGVKPNDDGKIVLNLVPNARLKEFRDNNVTISKERDDMKASRDALAQIVGEDPEAFTTELTELRSTAQKVKDGELTAKTDIEEAVEARTNERTESMKASYESQLQNMGAALEKEKKRGDDAESRVRRTLIDREITAAVLDENSGVIPAALPQILRDAYDIFTVEDDDSVVPKKGDTIIYGPDGVTPMKASEWIESLKERSSFYFKSSQGGGAAGGKDVKMGNMTAAEIAKLSPRQKLELANKNR